MAPLSVDAYSRLASELGLTPSALAIAFCDTRPFVTSTIIGATSLAQLEENLSGFGVEWSDTHEDGIAAINAAFPDPWRMIVRDGG